MKKKYRKFKIIFLNTILIGIFFLFGISQAFAQCEISSPAPDFILHDLNGETFQLKQIKNKYQYVLISFLQADNSNSINKLNELVKFLEDCKPAENYLFLAILVDMENKEFEKDKFINLQKRTEVPINLLAVDNKQILEDYQIEGYPTIILLRNDLCVRKIYSKFTDHVEKSFYQYLTFIMTCQKSSSDSSCDSGVCPPPAGY